MKGIGDVMKKTSHGFMKNIIRKKFPKLANEEFELEQKMGECPECEQLTIPQYYIKRESDVDFRLVPLGSVSCVQCEDKRLANEAVTAHKRMKQEKVTSQFWIVPPELSDEGLATYKPEDPEQMEAFQNAVQYVKDFKSGDSYNLLFRGSYGGGKTHLMKGIADAIKGLTKKDKDGDDIPLTVGFFTLDNLLDIVKGTYGRREGQTETEIINHVIGLDFLVIDDLGTESGEWAGKQLFKIINGRMGKPTAFSTNFMEWDDLARRFDYNGGKIVSRIRSNTKIIDLITMDMRAKKQRG